MPGGTQGPSGHSDGVRVLDRAEGVLIGLRRCSSAAAFAELVDAAKRHQVSVFALANALVTMASDGTTTLSPSPAAAAARAEWAKLLGLGPPLGLREGVIVAEAF